MITQEAQQNTEKKSRNRPPNAGKGRPKGAKNKTTKQAHEAIDYAFEAAGGQKKLAQWVNASDKNYETFITQLYSKRIPKNLDLKADFNFDIGQRLLEAQQRSKQLIAPKTIDMDNQGQVIEQVITHSLIEEIESEEAD